MLEDHKELAISNSTKSNNPNGSKRANGYVHVAKLLQDVGKAYEKDKKLLDESKLADESTDLYRVGDETEDISPDGATSPSAQQNSRKRGSEFSLDNVGDAKWYETKAGEVEINRNSVESSLAHGYGQMKLDAITSLVDGFSNAVYLGTMPDITRQDGVLNHYFAYPINYNGKRSYVFCRALHDNNTNRLYVHEVFVEDKIKKGNTLQTAASQPHGGISLYRDILANVLLSDGKDKRVPYKNKPSIQERWSVDGSTTISPAE